MIMHCNKLVHLKAKFCKIKTQGIMSLIWGLNVIIPNTAVFLDVNNFVRQVAGIFCRVLYIISWHCTILWYPSYPDFIISMLYSMAWNDHCDFVNYKFVCHFRLATCLTCHLRNSVKLQKTWIQLNHYM